jgi:hypothetical protein
MEIKKKTTVHLAKKKQANRLEIMGVFAKNRPRWR